MIARSHTIKRWIFTSMIALLWLPLLQMLFPCTAERPLVGVDPFTPMPRFSCTSWTSGIYQGDYERAIEKDIGFRSFFVRTHNQLNYSLFNSSDAGDVVVGKNDFIYLKPYIDAISGKDFRGTEYLSLQAEKLKVVQQALKKKGVDFFVVIAPGKGSFYPEYIPESMVCSPDNDSTNYACYRKLFSENGINFLDLRDHLIKLKNTEKYPLYSNTGVHWSEYACFLAGKEMIRYIEQLRGIDLPEVRLDKITEAELGTATTDYDAAALMNIFSSIPQRPAAIPELSFPPDTQTTRPHFLCISDSYFSGIMQTGIPSNVFDDYHNWLYFDRVFPESFLHEKHISSLEVKKELERQDVVCILCTDASLGVFPFGFADAVYEKYAPRDSSYRSLKDHEHRLAIIDGLRHIYGNPEWMRQLEWDAEQKGIPASQAFIQKLNEIYYEQQKKIKEVK